MSLTNWFDSVRAFVGQAASLPSDAAKARKLRAPRASLRLEELEDRTVPSASFGSAYAFVGAEYGSGFYGVSTGQAVATDSTGNVYLGGSFSDPAHLGTDFDPGPGVYTLSTPPAPGTNQGPTDGFIAKYAADGSLVWAARIGGVYGDSVNDVAVDAAGNVYICGAYDGPADFGTLTLTGTGAFAAKLDANGNFIWATALGGGSALGVAVDGSGNVYVTGDLTGNGLVAKLTASGALTWMANVAASGKDLGVDSAGNVVITGAFSGTVDFNPGAGTYNLSSGGRSSQPSVSAFVLKLNSSGAFVWADSFQASIWSGSDAHSLAVDASNNIYVTGAFGGTVDFDPGKGKLNLPNAGGDDVYVVKLDAAGKLIWAKSMGGPDHDGRYGGDLALDSAGSVYLTGHFSLTTDFDPGPGVFDLTSAGDHDIFVVKLTNAGSLDWAVSAGSTTLNRGYGIAVDGSGNVYTTGITSGTADFDPGPGLAEVWGPQNTAFLWKLLQP